MSSSLGIIGLKGGGEDALAKGEGEEDSLLVVYGKIFSQTMSRVNLN